MSYVKTIRREVPQVKLTSKKENAKPLGMNSSVRTRVFNFNRRKHRILKNG